MRINTLFLDRDGIINEVIHRNGVVSSPRIKEEFHIRDEFVYFYSLLPKNITKIFVVSNQPDVARGYLRIEDLNWMTEQLKQQFKFDDIVYCIHNDSDNCLCRKPKPGLLNSIIEKYSINKEKAIFIGDSWKDIEAGIASGIETIFYLTQYNKPGRVKADHIVENLNEAITIL